MNIQCFTLVNLAMRLGFYDLSYTARTYSMFTWVTPRRTEYKILVEGVLSVLYIISGAKRGIHWTFIELPRRRLVRILMAYTTFWILVTTFPITPLRFAPRKMSLTKKNAWMKLDESSLCRRVIRVNICLLCKQRCLP